MPNDFGVVLALAYVTFLDELDRAMAVAGFGEFGPWYGFVLRALEPAPLSLRELADRLEMSSPGALKIVDAMVVGGYLQRQRSPKDRRVRQIALADRGRAALDTARRFHATFEAELADQLGADRTSAARATLTAIVDRGSRRVPRLFRHP